MGYEKTDMGYGIYMGYGMCDLGCGIRHMAYAIWDMGYDLSLVLIPSYWLPRNVFSHQKGEQHQLLKIISSVVSSIYLIFIKGRNSIRKTRLISIVSKPVKVE